MMITTRTVDELYEGFRIFVFVLPQGDDQWLATSEVEREGAEGIEVFQKFGGPCQGRTAEEARLAVLADTRHKIDNVLAKPC